MRCWRAAAALLALAAVPAGCGSSGTQPGGFTYETTLTVYSNLPLQGPQGALMTSINDGEILALEQAHARGMDRNVSFAMLNDAQASAGGWSQYTTTHAARAAGQDLGAIAYIGDFDSAATALSLPLINANGILQVSPGSSYGGLTDSGGEAQVGEPASHYPNGKRTFARLVPTDVQEAAATVAFMRSVAVKRVYVISDTAALSAPYDSVIAPLVAHDAAGAHIAVAGASDIDTAAPGSSSYSALLARIAGAHPDAVLLGAAPDAGARIIFRELHRALPAVKLFAPSTLGTASFLDALGAADSVTYVTSPILPLDRYPPSAQRVLSAYRSEFSSPPTAYSLYGYEAMASVLAAIEHAGNNPATQRQNVIRAYFGLGLRHSVIGTYRIEPSGDSTLKRFAGYRVGAGGTLIELRLFSG